MTKRSLLTATVAVCLLAGAAPAFGQGAAIPGLDEPYWQQKADYSIGCRLDPASHMLTGSEIIEYTNNSPDTLRDFYMHLYPNAFAEKASPLIRDYLQGTWLVLVGLRKSERGWIEIDTLSVDGRGVAFDVDGTILKGRFPAPLPPGGRASISLKFRELVRKKLGRAGYEGDHYDMAQWYPKMVVYDDNGWHPDQFRKGEFYGEFGDFDVEMTLPADYVVASTGVLVSGDPGWDGGGAGGEEKTLRFRAEGVHDFAWCADPDFVVERRDMGSFEIMCFYGRGSTDWPDTAMARSARAMEWLEDFAGPYGYPQVSVVEVPSAGGMEYPMLIMNGNASERLIFHELGHNWFYGMLANDEREEAWLDEGMTSFQTYDYLVRAHGPYGKERESSFLSSFFDKPRLWERLTGEVVACHRAGFQERVATPHHEFKSCARSMVYTKSTLFMRALRYYVGDEDFRRIMHTYFDRWKFKHVDEEAFRSVCEEVSGLDLEEFFLQWLHSTKDCDYRISRFKVRGEGGEYSAEVRVERKGEMIMPLTLAFRLADGNTYTERIDGLPREYEDTFTFPVKPVSLALNPDNEILDIYMRDNFAPRRRDLRLDWVHGDHFPDDSYVYDVLPLGYYNDIDGGKAGLRIRRSYAGIYRKLTLQGVYGFESENLDFYGSFENPLPYLGRECTWRTSGYYREGRKGADLAIRKTRRKHLSEPLAKTYTLKLSYQELTDSSYVYPGTYEEGVNLKSSLWIEMHPKTDVFRSSLLLGLERSFWGSDFRYEKLTFETTVKPSPYWPVPVLPRMRVFFGRATMDPPAQELFNLAGAGPIDKEDYFWLRSRGAFWKDYYTNFHVPGDANLRGYYDGDFSFRSIFSSNIELGLPLPLGESVARLGGAELYLFYDYGKVLDEEPLAALPAGARDGLPEGALDGFLQDAGAGIRFWKLKAEFPFYLSSPELAGFEEKWDYRWTVGIESLF